jgi:spore germination cell wall hydrolase CwlJ-like protein
MKLITRKNKLTLVFTLSVSVIAMLSSGSALSEPEVPLNYSEAEEECMNLAVYGEARGESKMGWLLVMEVINNRKMSNKYPNHVCDVIKQHKQFSFWQGDYRSPKNKRVYMDIQKLTKVYLSGKWGYGVHGLAKGSMWYHADYVRPKWSKNLVQVWYVDSHIFYKQH